MPRPLAVLLLVICTMLWGIAFLFQKGAMAHMGPLTFTAIRYLLGALVIAPFALAEYRRQRPKLPPFTGRQARQLLVLFVSFFLGVWLQQEALRTTTVTNGGFLTSLYVIFTPLVTFVMARTRPHPIIYLGAPLALIGIFLLTGADLTGFTGGDGLLVLAAIGWAVQIAVLAPLVQETGMPVAVSAVTFLATAVLAAIGVGILEHPTIEAIGSGWVEIIYTGVASTAIAFTLQAIGQQYVPPANAAIILSGESLFAALGGAIVFGERLPLVGYLGAALILGAIVLVELVPILTSSARSPETG